MGSRDNLPVVRQCAAGRFEIGGISLGEGRLWQRGGADGKSRGGVRCLSRVQTEEDKCEGDARNQGTENFSQNMLRTKGNWLVKSRCLSRK
jgi:hypothetical protein